jgi:hypothetical protein
LRDNEGEFQCKHKPLGGARFEKSSVISSREIPKSAFG